MTLPRSFNETLQARVAADPTFRQALLQEAVQTFLRSDVDTGKVLLRDYINATGC